MAVKEIALELASFLDSDATRALSVPRDTVRSVATRFLSCLYDELGKAPRLLDAEDVRVVLGELLPGRFAPKDPRVADVPAVLEAFLDHLEASHVITQAFEIRRALEAQLPAFEAAVASGRFAARHAAERGRSFVHGAPKLGRNDPCSCGSGKKFKKCHGKES